MGKVQSFSIQLDNPSAAFFAGQQISGRLVTVLSGPVETRGIKITFVGEAVARWTERLSQMEREREERRHVGRVGSGNTVTRYAREVYLDHQLILSGDLNRKTQHTMPAGHHNLPFSYVLPYGLPSSFESPFGNVFYYCKGELDLPWTLDPSCRVAFTVTGFSDLNLQPGAMTSVSQSRQKTLGCMCCRSGPISAQVTIDRTGYVPGESILVNAEVENLTRSVITRTKAVVKMYTVFRAQGDFKRKFDVVMEVTRGPIQPGDSYTWNAVPVLVPPVPPTGLGGTCRIIELWYTLDFIVVPSGVTLNLNLEFPILIGTVPFRAASSRLQQYHQSKPELQQE